MDQKTLEIQKKIAIVAFPIWKEFLQEVRPSGGGLTLPDDAIELLGGATRLDWAESYLLKDQYQSELDCELKALFDANPSDEAPQTFWRVLLPKLCDFLSLMSFGESIFVLVARASNGDDSALFKCVQVDKTTLVTLPRFRERLATAYLTSDKAFLSRLSAAIKAPAIGDRIKYPYLLLLFAMLDDSHLLDMSLDDLMDVCEEVGVYGAEHGVEDRDSLRKRRAYYWKLSGRKS